MNIVVSNPKTGKAYQKKTESPVYLNKKIGAEVDLSVIGLDGYKGVIKGGSDKDGFPMKSSLDGGLRKRILIG
ncbi:MAG: S6e family ribosomal protein, partial [Candidatus Diapherotrites archaeon]|nr:S6e family ribosomal protein [Candidatus Diapherotrites archaeon]